MKTLLLVLGITAVLSASCVTTELTNEWRAPPAAIAEPRKVLVASDAPDESMRRNLEDNLSHELRMEGVAAEPSYRFEPTGVTVDPHDAPGFADQRGFDAVLVVTRLEQGYEMRYHPDSVYDYYSYGSWFTPFASADRFYPVGRTRVEARLIDADPGKRLIWAGVAETYEERSQARAAKKLAVTIADAIHCAWSR